MFENGHKKTGGRTKGTQNKSKILQLELLSGFVDSEIKKIPKLIKELTTKERLDFLVKVMPYVHPKKQEISVEKEIETLLQGIETLNEEQLIRLKQIIKECIDNGTFDK